MPNPPDSPLAAPAATAVEPLHKKRWLYILPVVFVTYSLAYLDRANYGFAAAAGMNKDLGISKDMNSFLGSLFFLGYFFFQIPGGIYAERRSAKVLIFWSLILWGSFAALTGVVTNVPMLMAIRFLIGVVEAAVLPAMLVFIANWFTKAERSRANTVLILGNPVTLLWMSILSGYLVQSFGWRQMFIIEGLPAVVWAVVWWLIAEDRPAKAKWLDAEEKQAIETQLEREQVGIKPVKNYREAFFSAKVIWLCVQYFCWSIGVYGFVLWLPSILKSAGNLGIVEAGWLSSVPYLAAVLAMITVSWASDKLMNRKLFVWPPLLIAAFAFFGSYAIGASNFWLSYVLLIIAGAGMYAPYGPFFAIVPEMLPRNVAGGAMALINSMGALGSFTGSFVVGWLNTNKGTGASYVFMASALVVSAIITMLVKSRPDEDVPSAANLARA